MGRLDGKVAIITGSGSGIGRSGAIIFAKEGAKVIVADRAAQTGLETARMIKEAGGEAVFVQANVSKADDVRRLIQTAVKTYGKLDILWNNAGILGKKATTVNETEENWAEVLDITLKGVWLGMKYAIPEIIKTGGGSIINTSSECAERGIPDFAAYTASKGGVTALTRSTAMEVADKNVRINAIAPGKTLTSMLAGLTEEMLKMRAEAIPQRRLGKPEDIAYAALFLASDESSHITGVSIGVDGGSTAC